MIYEIIKEIYSSVKTLNSNISIFKHSFQLNNTKQLSFCTVNNQPWKYGDIFPKYLPYSPVVS